MFKLLHQRTAVTNLKRATMSAVRVSIAAVSTSAVNGRVLDGFVPTTGDFAANKAHMDGLVTDLKATMAKIYAGGGESATQKHKARNKLTARERIDALVDAGSPFLEVGAMAGHDMYGDWVPAGGIVTGIGRVNG